MFKNSVLALFLHKFCLRKFSVLFQLISLSVQISLHSSKKSTAGPPYKYSKTTNTDSTTTFLGLCTCKWGILALVGDLLQTHQHEFHVAWFFPSPKMFVWRETLYTQAKITKKSILIMNGLYFLQPLLI